MKFTLTKRQAGFTLLELTLAIGILGLLTAGIFGLANGSIELTNELGEKSQSQLSRQRFVEICRRNIENLPATATIELRPTTQELAATEIAFHNHPVAFRFGGAATLPASVVVSSRPDGGGGFMARVHYLEVDDAAEYQNGIEAQNLTESPALNLIRGIHSFRWEFYDTDADEWLTEWDRERGRPSFVALHLRMLGDAVPNRYVFWLPPRSRPPQFQQPTETPVEPTSPENPDEPTIETPDDTETTN